MKTKLIEGSIEIQISSLSESSLIASQVKLFYCVLLKALKVTFWLKWWNFPAVGW
jgi:hypothetical protein